MWLSQPGKAAAKELPRLKKKGVDVRMEGVKLELIKELRQMTSASIADCKKALEESKGDLDGAVKILRKRGLEIAAKRSERIAKEGRVEAYVHLGNKIGVLVEINCETDFVARSEEFIQFAKDIAMQVAAMDAAYIRKEDVPKEVLAQVQDKELFIKEKCLLEQPFIKDTSVTIGDYLANLLAKFSENISVRRFVRYQLGQ